MSDRTDGHGGDTRLRTRRTPAPPQGTYLGMPGFPETSRASVGDSQLRRNLHHATSTIRTKRARAVAEIDEWEELRRAGAAIKDRTLRHLDTYLEQFEAAFTAAGGTVHWARDADEANRIVVDLVRAGWAAAHGDTEDAEDTEGAEVVKVKSMLTQEIDLNEALEQEGIAAWETDLAELIVQLGSDRPSHILVPAIHRNRAEVRELFLEQMGRYGVPAPEGLTDAPADLADAARVHLREKFLGSSVAISGANFAVADTGTLVVFESEGNGRMCLTVPRTLISVVGIEKLVPTFEDLEVFVRLLPRSSTAERMNPYTSMWTGASDGDGPQDVHVVLVDNGRTDVLADEVGRQALRCIRCSACLNICPVYERAGGHAYGSVYPGPIGAVLTPQLRGTTSRIDASLPFASTLCGACYEVCPVRIDIPELLVHMRHRVVEEKRSARRIPSGEALSMASASWVMGDATRWSKALALENAAGRVLGRRTNHFGPLPGPAAAWTDARDVPMVPRQSFRAWWQERARAGEAAGAPDSPDAHPTPEGGAS